MLNSEAREVLYRENLFLLVTVNCSTVETILNHFGIFSIERVSRRRNFPHATYSAFVDFNKHFGMGSSYLVIASEDIKGFAEVLLIMSATENATINLPRQVTRKGVSDALASTGREKVAFPLAHLWQLLQELQNGLRYTLNQGMQLADPPTMLPETPEYFLERIEWYSVLASRLLRRGRYFRSAICYAKAERFVARILPMPDCKSLSFQGMLVTAIFNLRSGFHYAFLKLGLWTYGRQKALQAMIAWERRRIWPQHISISVDAMNLFVRRYKEFEDSLEQRRVQRRFICDGTTVAEFSYPVSGQPSPSTQS